MVLLHGLTEDGTTWPDAVERWGDRFELIAPDLRGHGRSPRFTQSQLRSTGEVMLADVTALLDTLGRPVVLVGHSLGGYLAATAALARPDLVSAVVLEDPAKPANSAADRFDEDRFRREQVEFVDAVTAAPEVRSPGCAARRHGRLPRSTRGPRPRRGSTGLTCARDFGNRSARGSRGCSAT